MSASSARKKRLEQANLPATEAPKKKKKPSQGLIFGICMCLIVAFLVGGILIYRAVKENRTVLTVGDHKVSVKEFNYFYGSVANSIGSYASSIGIESGIPLDQQYVPSDFAESASYLTYLVGGDFSSYLADKEAVDGVYNVTWAQLIASVAKDNAVSAYAVYNEAMKAGYQMDDHLKHEIDETMETVKGYADTNNMSLDGYLKNMFGTSSSVRGYREYLTVRQIAAHYPSSLRYSDEEIKARFDSAPESYTVATYYRYSVSAASFVEADEEGNKPDPTDEDRQKAEDAAKEMEQAFDTADASVSILSDNTRATVTSSVSAEAAAWMFDTANAGDVKTFENNGTYYVVKLIDKSDYLTMNGLELVISADSGELAEGEKTAADKVAEIKASLAADPSEANFRSLIEAYGGEPEDLERLTRSTLGSVSNDVLKWYLDGIKAGDWTAAEVNGSTIFLYCTGLDDTYSNVTVTNALASEWQTSVIDAAKAAAVYDEAAAMTANVGLSFTGN